MNERDDGDDGPGVWRTAPCTDRARVRVQRVRRTASHRLRRTWRRSATSCTGSNPREILRSRVRAHCLSPAGRREFPLARPTLCAAPCRPPPAAPQTRRQVVVGQRRLRLWGQTDATALPRPPGHAACTKGRTMWWWSSSRTRGQLYPKQIPEADPQGAPDIRGTSTMSPRSL